jgi:NADPH:quinone reductase-like Zn-dependent oxidoreductase
MHAVRIHEFGGPEVLKRERVELPDAQADELLIRVAATSVNPVDYKIRQGKFPLVTAETLPITAGRDFSGIVELVGAPSFTLDVGDEVYGMPGFDRGTNAEFIVVRANEVARKPATLDEVEAACVPLAALTAWQGLFDHGELQAGQRVLIHGGAGGVGHFAVQFAKAKGAFVVATASGRDQDFVRELGADLAIDYKAERFENVAGEIDVVLDLQGGETQERSWAVLKKGGVMISARQEPSPERAKEKAARAIRFICKPNAHQLTDIAQLIDKGEVRPVISQIFTIDTLGDAQDFVEKGGFRGKVAVRL